MKIVSIQLTIVEKDFELFEEELNQTGWIRDENQRLWRKMFGNTEVELKEHLLAFGPEVTLKVSARNERGIDVPLLSGLLFELERADSTADE
jgi:hypothetical protein